MHRWRLVYPACYRFKIVDAKGVRKYIPIPSHYVERVIQVVIRVNIVLFFDVEKEVAALVNGLKVNGFANVALAKRGMLQQLAKFIAITFRCSDGASALHNEKAVIGRVEMKLVSGAARDDYIIAILKWQHAIHSEQFPGAFMDENHLIGIRVFIEIVRHAFAWCGENDLAICIHQHGLARAEVIIFCFDVKSF